MANSGTQYDQVTGTDAGERILGTIRADLIFALGGDDIVFGRAGNDQIDGGEGDDRLDGGIDNDRLIGGTGIDTAAYGTATAGVIVSLAIAGQQNTVSAGSDTLIGIENLAGSDFDDILTGDRGANVLSGGLGDDILIGGAGIDTASYADAKSGVTVGLFSVHRQQTGGSGTDTIREIENLVGSAYDDVLSGDAGTNVLDGGAGVDTVSYARAAAGVRVNLALTTRQGTGGDGVDTLTGFENVTGSAFDDQLTGDAGRNTLTGNAGNDTLIGGRGNDILDGGAGIDTASYADATRAVNVNLLVTTPQNTSGGDNDTLISIENLIGSSYGDRLTGNAQNNVIFAGNGNDIIDGGTGADTLDGGNNDDVLTGGAGDDLLIGGNGRDVMTGGLGNDRFTFQTVVESRAGTSADRITDFGAGDVVDLSAIDARTATPNNNAFAFVSAFNGNEGQLTLAFNAATNTTTLLGDVNGDSVADFSILFTGNVTPSTGTWVL